MRAPLLALLALGVALAPAAGQTRAPTRDWHPSDRTVIRDFRRITSVAAASDRVFISSPTSLLIWDPQFQRWDGPYDPPRPGLLSRIFAALVDPVDNSLWLGRPDGWVHYQPDIQLWESGSAPGVREIAFDLSSPLSGIFLRTAGGWLMVPRGGGIATPSAAPQRPVTPTSVDDLIRANPTLQAYSAQILTDERMQPARYTAAAQAFDRRGWYIGTSGLGLLYLPEGSPLPQRLTFGVGGDRIGAVFAAPGGVWAASDRTPQSESALTFIASDLSRFEIRSGPAATGLPFDETRRLVGQGTSLWAATNAGVVRIDPNGGRTQVYDQARGLPDSRVWSLVSRRGAITAGTAHGVARITDSAVTRVAPAFDGDAYAVYEMRDTVWVGTGTGLLAGPPNQRVLIRPAKLAAAASLQVPVVAIAQLGDTLVALTEDQLLWRDPGSGDWSLGPNLSAVLGRLTTFVPGATGFWVAGERGLSFARLDSPPMRPLFEGDVPGPINDLAVDADYLWVGTDAGLVRFRLDAIRP